jgi:hypothetical protein
MPDPVLAVLRVMPGGGGFPSLVETASGRRFVMKVTGAGQGAAGLASELIATRLAGALGLEVPAVAPIHLPQDLPWQTGTDEFYETLQRSAGPNLGIAFVEDARDLGDDDLASLPAPFLERLAMVDALLQNVDRTTKNPNLLRDAEDRAWAIDFGACLFLERYRRQGTNMGFALSPNHFLAGRAPGGLAVDRIRPRIAGMLSDLPRPWIAAMQLDRVSLLRLLGELLDTYSRWAVPGTRPDPGS